MKKSLLLSFLLFIACGAQAQIITTVAGDSTGGYNGDNIPAITASLDQPIGIAIDRAGNIYIGDRDNNRIRKVDTYGIIHTIAGTGTAGYTGDNGPATNAKINWPYGVAVDDSGNVYFADDNNFCVRKINTIGIITTIAGTGIGGYNGDNIPATAAQLSGVGGLVVDNAHNIYMSDGFNNRVRKVDKSGIITTIAGTGTPGHGGDGNLATIAEIYVPYGLAIDKTGNIYIAEDAGACIRKIDNFGIITTIAGTGYGGDNGPATAAELGRPVGVAVDRIGNVYIAEAFNHRIRKVDTFGIITTIAGTGVSGYNGDGEPATGAKLFSPAAVYLDAADNLFISDFGNSRIRYIRNTLFVNNIATANAGLAVFPNPNSGHFYTKIYAIINQPIRMSITNIMGEKMQELMTATNTETEVRFCAPSGIYFLTATGEHGLWYSRIVIE